MYNGRDKSFFFFNWEQLKYTLSTPVTSTIPTVAERGSDFSDRLTTTVVGTNPCDGSPIYTGQIFDPATTKTVNGSECRTAFAGNVIPAGRLSSVAKALVAVVNSQVTVWLRIVKRNVEGHSRYTGYSSNDGVTWIQGGTWVHSPGDAEKICLYAGNQAGFVASFHYVHVSTVSSGRADLHERQSSDAAGQQLQKRRHG